jgi:uncharacterized membrane protein
MDLTRIMRHLSSGRASVRRAFPQRTLDNIERSIAEAERTHAGQIRFVVEDALDLRPLLVGQTARERAIEVFSQLRVWDTEQNNGVLIYLLLADRDVEIVADRGVHAKLGQAVWEEVCREMEAAFRQGRFEEGAVAGIRSVGMHLARHYPQAGSKTNEMPDRPILM